MAAKKKQRNATPGGIGIDGKRLAAARRAREWSQFELAKRTDYSPTNLSLIEGGRKGVSDLTLKRLALALDVTADYLLGISDGPRR